MARKWNLEWNLRRVISVLVAFVIIMGGVGVASVMSVKDAQLLVDGNMEDSDGSPTSAWTEDLNVVVTKETTNPHSGSQVLRVAYGGTANPFVRQNVVTVGKTYRITGWARGDGTYGPTLYNGGAVLWNGTNSTSWQYFDETFTAASVQVRFRLGAGAAGYCEFDDVVVTEYTPPVKVKEGQILVDGNMEDSDGSPLSAWTLGGAGAVLTKETGTPYQGSQVLRITDDAAYASQSIMAAGTTYRIIGRARGNGTNVPKVYQGGTLLWTGTSLTSWQYFDIIRTASGLSTIRFYSIGTVGNYTEFDDIYVTEYHPPVKVPDTQLLVDGNMEDSDGSPVSAWTGIRNPLFTKETTNPHGGSQVVRIAYIDENSPYIYQPIFTIGKTYRMTGWARSDGTNIPRAGDGSGGITWDGTTSTDWQYFDATGIAGHSYLTLMKLGGTAGYTEFDDVYVTEVAAENAAGGGWSCGDVVAHEGTDYSTVSIGGQCWFAENINIGTKITSCDGGYLGVCTDASPPETAQDQGTDCPSAAEIEKYCYNDDEANCTADGALYQWNQAMCGSTSAGAQGICPTDWHIPTDDEWKTLETALGMCEGTASDPPPYCVDEENQWRGTDQGTQLKTGGTSGFEALLPGYRAPSGAFLGRTSYAHLWSSLESGGNAWRRYLYSGLATVCRGAGNKAYGFSARCLKD